MSDEPSSESCAEAGKEPLDAATGTPLACVAEFAEIMAWTEPGGCMHGAGEEEHACIHRRERAA
jgi:hypothetical protein